jgi:hypothetical protein
MGQLNEQSPGGLAMAKICRFWSLESEVEDDFGVAALFLSSAARVMGKFGAENK